MAKSSIHIANGHGGYLAHNDRSQETVNSIFPHNKNEIWNTKEEGFKIYKMELAARSDAYSKRTGQKLQKKATTHLSAIVNLNEKHTLEDVKKVASLLERELDTKVFQIALHRDEGHVSDDGKEIVNYHAHIEFLGLDQEGRSIRQKLKRKTLINLQSDTAMVLGMERGTEYVKERKTRPKRLDTYEYKAHKKEESKTVKVTQKALKSEIKTLKAQLADSHAKLEQLNRDLKERIRAKDLTAEEMQQDIEQLKHDLYFAEDHNKALKAKISTLPSSDTFEELKTLKSDFQQLEKENNKLHELAYEPEYTREVDSFDGIHDVVYSYKELYTQNKGRIEELEQDNAQLKEQVSVLTELLHNTAKYLELGITKFVELFQNKVPSREEVEHIEFPSEIITSSPEMTLDEEESYTPSLRRP